MLPQTHTMYLPASALAKQDGPGQPAGTNIANSQGQVVIIQTAPNSGPNLYSAYNSKRGKILGSIQIAAGIVSVLAAITGVALYSMLHSYFAFSCIIGTGLWCGVFVSTLRKQ